jgi:hypothetical protein
MLQTWYDDFGGGWHWHGFGSGMATTIEEETPVGTLMVDIFDTPSQKLIWRGIASGTLTGKPEKDEKKMDKAVTEMFKKFPPRPTSYVLNWLTACSSGTLLAAVTDIDSVPVSAATPPFAEPPMEINPEFPFWLAGGHPVYTEAHPWHAFGSCLYSRAPPPIHEGPVLSPPGGGKP